LANSAQSRQLHKKIPLFIQLVDIKRVKIASFLLVMVSLLSTVILRAVKAEQPLMAVAAQPRASFLQLRCKCAYNVTSIRMMISR
jgi:hypothetical protein